MRVFESHKWLIWFDCGPKEAVMGVNRIERCRKEIRGKKQWCLILKIGVARARGDFWTPVAVKRAAEDSGSREDGERRPDGSFKEGKFRCRRSRWRKCKRRGK
ncbi:unnamed protein product [Lactuca virosa]|uniref:Uncharacterized protein n=1 Tax=Lactuca virosa TaxID=75947 RepID=A0AAU9NV64_9ASTR|nr:unnamed protein product [Lactuca virosa]